MRIAMSCLWNLFHGHSLRLLAFAAVSVPKNAAGNSLLYVEVSQADINKYAAHAMNLPLVTLIGFFTSLVIWWSRGTPMKKARRFTQVELVMYVAGQACFALLAGGLGVPYMAASGFNMVVLGLTHYVILDKRVFSREKTVA